MFPEKSERLIDLTAFSCGYSGLIAFIHILTFTYMYYVVKPTYFRRVSPCTAPTPRAASLRLNFVYMAAAYKLQPIPLKNQFNHQELTLYLYCDCVEITSS
jgi:hypothetical protein